MEPDFVEFQTFARVIVIVLGLLCFLGICYWVYGVRGAQSGFEEAAQLPFTEDDDDAALVREANQRKDG